MLCAMLVITAITPVLKGIIINYWRTDTYKTVILRLHFQSWLLFEKAITAERWRHHKSLSAHNTTSSTSERWRHIVKMHASAIIEIQSGLWPWPLTSKTFSAMATHMMNICVRFHRNTCTKYR